MLNGSLFPVHSLKPWVKPAWCKCLTTVITVHTLRLTVIDLTEVRLRKESVMRLHPTLQPIVALVAGILILLYPGLLATVVAVYLIVIGILGLLGKRL